MHLPHATAGDPGGLRWSLGIGHYELDVAFSDASEAGHSPLQSSRRRFRCGNCPCRQDLSRARHKESAERVVAEKQ